MPIHASDSGTPELVAILELIRAIFCEAWRSETFLHGSTRNLYEDWKFRAYAAKLHVASSSEGPSP